MSSPLFSITYVPASLFCSFSPMIICVFYFLSNLKSSSVIFLRRYVCFLHLFLFYFFTTLTKSLKALFLKVFPTPTLYFSEVKNHFFINKNIWKTISYFCFNAFNYFNFCFFLFYHLFYLKHLLNYNEKNGFSKKAMLKFILPDI